MNHQTVDFSEGPSYPELALRQGVLPFSETASEEERPDGRVFVIDENQEIAAHAALWWNDTPDLEGEKIGAIGGFTSIDEESAKAVLDKCAEILVSKGSSVIVGPMNGNTWRRHRFVTWSEGRPSYLLEPRNEAAYPGWWQAAGFSELSHYSSSLMPLDGQRALPEAVKRRLEKSGVTLRRLNPDCYDDELRLIHQISLASFSSNFLYTPLEEESFIQAYRKVRGYVDVDFVRIAVRDGHACGFVFGIPDLEALQRGEKPALIVKTLAVDPAARCAGLGTWLVDEIHESAREKGYSEAIHALQHETNTSLKITGRHHGEVFRRYSLFHKRP